MTMTRQISGPGAFIAIDGGATDRTTDLAVAGRGSIDIDQRRPDRLRAVPVTSARWS
jgi:hypothetical protein